MLDLKRYFLILGVSLAVSIGLQLLLPFPYGLIITLALFVMIPLFIQRRFRRMRGAPSGIDSFFGLGRSRTDTSNVKYSCLVCDNKFSGGSCPRCGSKLRRADF